MAKERKKAPSDWELEAPFDVSATMEDLINAPPFKEASDEHGHSTTAGTRIPSWLQRRVIKLRELPGSPYDLSSDVYRDALYLGLQILHMRYRISPDWDVERKMAAIVDATGAGRRIKEMFDEFEVGLEELHRDGDTKHAAERLTDYVHAAANLDNDWHRGRIFRLLGMSRVVREVGPLCDKEVQGILKKEG